jgi:class 3 adenylate cyclase
MLVLVSNRQGEHVAAPPRRMSTTGRRAHIEAENPGSEVSATQRRDGRGARRAARGEAPSTAAWEYARQMRALPRGTVTFLFTDVHGSTELVKKLGERYGAVLASHQRLLRATFVEHAGTEIDTQGDAFFVAFGGARDAVGRSPFAWASTPARPTSMKVATSVSQ